MEKLFPLFGCSASQICLRRLIADARWGEKGHCLEKWKAGKVKCETAHFAIVLIVLSRMVIDLAELSKLFKLFKNSTFPAFQIAG